MNCTATHLIMQVSSSIKPLPKILSMGHKNNIAIILFSLFPSLFKETACNIVHKTETNSFDACNNSYSLQSVNAHVEGQNANYSFQALAPVVV